MLAAALTLTARGWPVFPCEGKRPRTQHGLDDATTDRDAVERWWGTWPAANVAVRTGTGSGLFVLDVDPDHDGADTLHDLEARHGELPPTVEALTGGGGRHIYFCHPGGLRNTAGKLGPGLDTRGDGGYVVAPPSVHTSGRTYEWSVDGHPDDLEPAELPAWLLELLRKPATGPTNATPPEEIRDGERNATLFRYGCRLRRDGATPDEIVAALLALNTSRCRPPLPGPEVTQIAESAARYEHEAPVDLTVLTARATCALPDPPASDELLGPLLMRANRLVLGAHTGHGKTTIALAIVRAVTTGSELFGWRGGGGRALIIDAEQGLRTVKRRLTEAGLHDSEHVDYLRVPDGLALDQDADQVAAIEAQLAAGDYAVLVADPLYKLHRGESNEERAAVDLMRQFDAWREQYRFALVLPVHCRKPPVGAKFSMHEFFGSSAYLRGAEVVVGLQRVRDGYAFLHYFKDRDGDLPIGAKWGLLFDREQGYRRDPDDGAPKQTAGERVRELLDAQPGMTETQLMEATGLAERTIRKALRDAGATAVRAGQTAAKLWTVDPDETPA